MADVTLKIDDKEVVAPAGMLLTEAARRAGIDIPVFCSHPKLDPLGACRMCMVEIEGPRGARLMTACTTPVADGMVVHTKTPVVKEAQEAVLEFILTNHPLDCPICDKGGECPLQDQTLHYGPAVSDFEEQKVGKAKRYPISPLIMLDQERCILCWRCIRYLEEWADDPQLGLFERGGRTTIDIFPNQPVTSKTSGSIIDLCPVGALTNRVARFHYRPWQLTKVKSVCSHCSVGCNFRIDVRNQEIRRIVARENMQVNDEWICDKGRFAHGFVDSEARLKTPLVRRNGELQEASWDEALEAVVQGLGRIVRERGAEAVGGIGSAKLTNEAAYLFQKFMRTVIGTNNVDHKLGSAVKTAPVSLSAITDLQKADVLFLFASDPSEEAPILELHIKRAVRRKGAKLLIAHPRKIELTRYEGPYLAYKPGTEAALLNGLAHIILKEGLAADTARRAGGFGDLEGWLADATPEATAEITGVDIETLRSVARQWAKAERGILLYGPAAVQGPRGEATMNALANLVLIAGQTGKSGAGLAYLGKDANSQGARDVGLLPDTLPGYQPLDDAEVRKRLGRLWSADLPTKAGMGYRAMLDAAKAGDLAGLYIIASDPAGDNPADREALEALSFLVVQEMFLTETAKLADVVLPAASFAEQEGTFTNVERRVQRLRQALRPKGQSVADWSILLHLAERWPQEGEEEKKGRKPSRAEWRYESAAAIFQEMTKAVPLYAGLTWEGLGELGQQPDVNALPKITPRFRQVEISAAAKENNYPSRLLVGSLLYDRGTILQHCHEQFKQVLAEPYVLIHPQDAAQIGVSAGDHLHIASPHGDMKVPLRLSDAVQPGVLWMPESVTETPVGALLDGSASVAVRVEKAT